MRSTGLCTKHQLVLTEISRRDHVSPILTSPHKTQNRLQRTSPDLTGKRYLKKLIAAEHFNRLLRAQNDALLVLPRSKQDGGWALSHQASPPWDQLPVEADSLSTTTLRIKTFFEKASWTDIQLEQDGLHALYICMLDVCLSVPLLFLSSCHIFSSPLPNQPL